MTNQKSVFQSLKDVTPYLKQAQMKVAQFLQDNPDRLINMSIVQVSRETGTAPSTVVEFCKKMGFPGFKSLKIAVAQEMELMKSMKVNMNRVADISSDLATFVFANVQEALSLIDKSELKKAAQVVTRSSVVDILAFGFDSVAANDLFLKLKEFGYQVNCFHNPFLQSISASRIGKEGCSIAISSSHSSRDLLDSMRYARHSGAVVIAVAPPDSTIAQEADIVLPTYTRTKVLPEGGFLTRYVQMFVVDMLVLRMMEIDKTKFSRAYREFEQILNHKRRGDAGVV